MDVSKVQARLQEHLVETMKELKVTDWFFISACGSMNYNLDDESSDIDSKLIIIPTLDDIIDHKEPNYLHIMSDNGEHCEVKGLAHYMSIVRKQNINFTEVFFTDNILVNPKYEKEFYALRKHVEELVFLDPLASIYCPLGMMRTKYNQMFKESDGRKENIEKYGYDTKSFLHLNRLANFVDRFINALDKTPYRELITYPTGSDEHKVLMGVKHGAVSAEKAEVLAKRAIESTKIKVDVFGGRIKENLRFSWRGCEMTASSLAKERAKCYDDMDATAHNIIKTAVCGE